MANYRVSGADLTSVADAIRTKGGISASLSFPDGFVSAVQNIPTGGGSTLITKNITENGTYSASSDNADGYSEVSVAVSPKFVMGTFTGADSEKGTAKAIQVPYTGDGYPIALLVYPSVGAYKTGSTLLATLQKNAIILFSMAKTDMSLTPTYGFTGENNSGTTLTLYKNSDTDAAATTSNRGNTVVVYQDSAAGGSHSSAVRMRSATDMSVFIASTSYGFMAGVEYTYQIVYSS